MHQRLTSDPFRIAQAYERGVFTHVGAANDIVEATEFPPSPELIAALPPEILDRIRELASRDFENPILIASHCSTNYDPEAYAEYERECVRAFRVGHGIWRAYFGPPVGTKK